MMPVTGGYYQWVKRGLGLRWAFYEGWWTWLYTFVDLAIYPVLFVQYASFFFPQIEGYKLPVCLVIIWSSAALNIRGIVPVGKTSIFLGSLVLIPFIVLFVVSLSKYWGQISLPAQTLKAHSFSSIGMALYTIMWNFIGWDNTTTYADEVDKPGKSYLASIITAFCIVLMIYLIAILIAIQSGISAEVLTETGFPALGTLVGGHWLGAIISIGGMASALGLYSAVLLSVSRVPKVMSDDKLLPRKLSALHPRFNSPYGSILTCSAVVSFMILWTFTDLLIIDVTLYGAALFLEYIALIRLRIIAPQENRPFKIPLNIAGLCLMILLPLTVYCIALTAAFTSEGSTIVPALFAVATLLTAEVMWRIATRLNKIIN
jgi:amino acid transporter